MKRSEKIAWGTGAVLVVIIIWLLMRRHVGASGDVNVGPVSFGGYTPGSYDLSVLPDTYNFDFDFAPPAPGVSASGGDTPCACGCESNTVNFLDLTGYADALQDNLVSQTVSGLQAFFSANPTLVNFANSNQIALFQEGYETRRTVFG